MRLMVDVWNVHVSQFFTYHVAQASQAKHGSLVDRVSNGRLTG